MNKFVTGGLSLMLLPGCLCGTEASAAGKLTVRSRANLRASQSDVRFDRENNTVVRKSLKAIAPGNGDNMVRAFLTTSDPESAVAELEALGAVIDKVRGGTVLAQFPADILESVEAIDAIEKIQTETKVAQRLDKVREAIGIDKIHNGTGLPQAYTGKGVVAAIVDGGFDPNHVNFLNEDGTSRIGQFTYFRAQQGTSQLVEERYPREYIPNIDTENAQSFHATHTTGIMAGSYRGDLTAAIDLGDGTAELSEIENPYYGIATGADIAAAAAYNGQLSDYYIAMGVESILDYAFTQGSPAVINLSLGNNVGPHDGTSPVCQYLDAVTADTQVNSIVCIAAGNEGEMAIALNARLTEEQTTLGTGLRAMYDGMLEGYRNPRQGQFYIYSDTAEPFEVQLQVVNMARGGKVAKRMVLEASPEGASKYWVTEAGFAQAEGDIVDAQLGRYFHGYAGINAECDAVSGRYYAVVEMTIWDNEEGSNPDGSYILGVEVSGKPGQRIDFYGDGSMCDFSSFGVPGYSDGMFDGTISDIATGFGPIVVGSYNTRDTFPCIDGWVYGYEGRFPYGGMSGFTSFGTLADGRSLPDICAPGATVVSSSNEYYLDFLQEYGESEQIQAFTSIEGRNHSYHQCIGTSMATPVVAGSIALWLEAWPELTQAQAKEIILSTAVKDEAVETQGYPGQWGAGKFDAYAGLKEVLRLKAEASVKGVADDGAQRLEVRMTGNRTFDILTDSPEGTSIGIYSASGAKALNAIVEGGVATADASALPAGVYVINNNGATAKIILK